MNTDSYPVEYQLLINRNCGAGPYQKVATSTDLSALQKTAEKYSAEGARWVIQDVDGDLVDVSPIHKTILRTVASFDNET